MPATIYSNEQTFAQYLLMVLGSGVVADLGIEIPVLQVVVEDALLDYGVDDIAAATNLKKLRAMGKVRVWEWVASQYATQYRMTTQRQTLDRQQKWDHAKKMLESAQAEVAGILALELVAADADGGWDYAEMVLDPFSARQRAINQALRGGY
jgi:hypothetical protein